MLIETAAVLLCPIGLGMLAGVILRQRMQRRLRGASGLLACLVLPTAVATALTVRFPIVGLWDGVTEGFLCGVGLLWSAHRLYADPRNVLLTTASVAASFLLLEIAARLFLGMPPAFPAEQKPHFFLSTLLRTLGPDSPTFRGALPYFLETNAMRADPRAGRMEDRAPSAMVTREIVCSIVYGPAYAGVLDVTRERAVVFPESATVPAGTARRVLHVGDSMVFGANVAREHTFTVKLGELEPGVQHINGGISGMAPDDYLAVLRSWVAREPVDLVVMYLFAGNDLIGMDAPHPCSNWESLLVYDGGHATLRFPSAPHSDRRIGLQWLLTNSPLPYLGRVMIAGHSTAAAFLGARLDSWSAQAAGVPPEVQMEHLESILRSARDELHQKHIAFVVVVLPAAGAIDMPGGPSDVLSKWVRGITERLHLPELDATEPIRAALARGEKPIQGDQVHFNEAGHTLMAQWLHERLAAAAGITDE